MDVNGGSRKGVCHSCSKGFPSLGLPFARVLVSSLHIFSVVLLLELMLEKSREVVLVEEESFANT